jgi:hypothetical protein
MIEQRGFRENKKLALDSYASKGRYAPLTR